MDRTYIRSLYAAPESFGGGKVELRGWARSVRDSKNIGFTAS